MSRRTALFFTKSPREIGFKSMSTDYHVNAVGRKIPKHIPGYGETEPFMGCFTKPPPEEGAPYIPRFFKPGREKLSKNIDEALTRCGIQDGWHIGINHDLRDGVCLVFDIVINRIKDKMILHVVEACERLGIKDLVLYPSALFPCHRELEKFLNNGTISRIEGSLNGYLGVYASKGCMKYPAVLRSHGGRVTAISLGRIKIDLTVVIASATDCQGNCNGQLGKSKFGTLGFSQTEIPFSRHSLVLSDTLVDYPCFPNPINQSQVDHVVIVDSIGDTSGIATGTMQIREREPELTIANMAVSVMEGSGQLKSGVVIQCGAGAASLLAQRGIARICKEKDIVIALANGGTTQQGVDMLRSGVFANMASGQVFDVAATDSLIEDSKNHVPINVNQLYNIYNSGCGAYDQDFAFLSATEIDVDFNVNVNTHSDGYLKHGIGGHSDAACSKIAMVLCPLARKDNPIVIDRVTTVTTPGELVDVVVTEGGIAVNPRRNDLKKKLIDAGLPVKPIEELRDAAMQAAGRAYTPPKVTDRIIGVIEYRDGSVLDVVYGVEIAN